MKNRIYSIAMYMILITMIVLSFIEGLYGVTVLFSFLLSICYKPLRNWLLTPDEFY